MKHSSDHTPINAGQQRRMILSSSPFERFVLASVIGLGALVALSIFMVQTQSGLILPLMAGVAFYLVAVSIAAGGLRRTYEHEILGLCNLVTLARLVLVGTLVIVIAAQTPAGWGVFALTAIALGLDGIDGWLARRQGVASRFGARFDVEVDAVFAFCLAIYAYTNGSAGPFVLLLGVPHYLFWLARLRFDWLNNDLPESFARKSVCVFQIGTLIALQVPFLADGRLDLVIVLVSVALIWSFGRDIIWLKRTAA